MDSRPRPNVFISYAHDSNEHKQKVAELARVLRDEGNFQVQYDGANPFPAEGWPNWMRREFSKADFVLVVCSATYLRRMDGKEEKGKGLGSIFEGHLIVNELYAKAMENVRIIPIILQEEDRKFVPDVLQAYTYYVVSRSERRQALFDYMNQGKVDDGSGHFATMARDYSVAVASGVPKLVILGGVLRIEDRFRASASFSGDDVQILLPSMEVGNVGPTYCEPCQRTDILRTNAMFFGSSLRSGSLVLKGKTFDKLSFAGSLEFIGSDVVLSEVELQNELVRDFTFRGSLEGYSGDAMIPDPITPDVRVRLYGQGNLHVTFKRLLDPHFGELFSWDRIEYRFEDRDYAQ